MNALRTLLVPVLLCGLTASAQSRQHSSSNAAAGSLLDLGLGVGPALSLDQQPPLMELMPSVLFHLPLHAPISLDAGLVVGLQFGSTNANNGTGSIFAAQLLPTVRVAGELFPRLRLYGDIGVGLILGSSTATFFGTSLTSSITGLGIRLAAGGEYWLLDNVAVFLEPIGYQLQNGTASTRLGNTVVNTTANASQWTLMLGGRFRF